MREYGIIWMSGDVAYSVQTQSQAHGAKKVIEQSQTGASAERPMVSLTSLSPSEA